MYSLGQIARSLKQFAEDHRQLTRGRFHYGYLSDLLKDKEVPGPILVMTRESKSMSRYTDDKNFSVIIADTVHDFKNTEGVGLGNELEIDSGTEKIGMDLVEFFRERFSSVGLTLSEPVSFEPFFYTENSHKFSGWRLPVTFHQNNEHNYCSIPIDDSQVPDETVMFSGVWGGAPDTVYTNRFIGGTP